MISVAEASAAIAALLAPVDTEIIPLTDAHRRVLRAPVVAKRDQPPFAASAMDGYALQASDKRAGNVLRVIGEVAAGQTPERPVGAGEAMRIFTGAPVPEGADTILIQEDAERAGDTITIRGNIDAEDYIRPAGCDFQQGASIDVPRRLSATDLALIAAMNAPTVTVSRRPVVAIIATGDELVWPGETPRGDQIVASNPFGLKAMLEDAGAEIRVMPIAPDTTRGLSQTFELAAGADLVVTMGGASVGDHDLVQEAATSGGLDLAFYKIAMRPGKPLMAGRLGMATLIGLPGNPVSSLVCGHIFVRPAIDALLGLGFGQIETMPARLAAPLGPNGKREHYMRATATRGQDGWHVTAAARQDSSLLSVLSAANALLIRPPNDPAKEIGAPVTVTML